MLADGGEMDEKEKIEFSFLEAKTQDRQETLRYVMCKSKFLNGVQQKTAIPKIINRAHGSI